MSPFFRRRHRERLRERPLPAAWIELLEEKVPYHSLLTEEERILLHGHIQVFLDEKHFEGCKGFEVADEVRLVIAAQACMLLLNIDIDYFPRLESILVYSDAFVVEHEHRDEAGFVVETPEVFVGESWNLGAVVFSWHDIERDTRVFNGHNVVFHEFAHQIDQADGAADGWPDHLDGALEERWLEVMGREYEAHREAAERRREPFIDRYGAKNPAEFFAVVTETFFERPRELQERHPELYDVFSLFYRQDPVVRFG